MITNWRLELMVLLIQQPPHCSCCVHPCLRSLLYLIQSSDLSYFLERQRAEPLLGILTMESSLPQRVRLQGVSHGQVSPLFFCSSAATQWKQQFNRYAGSVSAFIRGLHKIQHQVQRQKQLIGKKKGKKECVCPTRL